MKSLYRHHENLVCKFTATGIPSKNTYLFLEVPYYLLVTALGRNFVEEVDSRSSSSCNIVMNYGLITT